MSDVATDAAETVRNGKSTVSSARNVANDVVDEASRRASQASGRVREAGQQAAGYVRDQYGQLVEEAEHVYDRARDKAYQWEETAESAIKNRPWQALLTAAGIGALLALLWKRHD